MRQKLVEQGQLKVNSLQVNTMLSYASYSRLIRCKRIGQNYDFDITTKQHANAFSSKALITRFLNYSVVADTSLRHITTMNNYLRQYIAKSTGQNANDIHSCPMNGTTNCDQPLNRKYKLDNN